MANQFVAFMDERHGLGAWVAEQIAADLFRNPAEQPGKSFASKKNGEGESADLAGRPVSSADLSLSLLGSGSRRSYGAAVAPVAEAQAPSVSSNAYKTWTSPRASAEATSAAVISGQAQVGVLPLYEEASGFNVDTLNALIDFPQQVLGEYVAESNYVLAVPTDLIHEVDQAGFTDSFDGTGARSFQWNAEKQRKYRGRVGTVYASADAMRHCAAAVDGMRAKGIDVQLLPDGVDTYRAGLEQALVHLDPNREVSTTYGKHGQQRVSKTKASNHGKPLIGVLLAFDKALGDGGYSFDSDYKVLEAEMAGADRVRTSFLATTQASRGHESPPMVYDVPLFGDLVRYMMDEWSEAARLDMMSVKRLFTPREQPRYADSAGIRQTPGLSGAGANARRTEDPVPYARVLYAIPTAGPYARDHSKVLRRLAEAGLSYRTQPLDQRAGMPIALAIDVPNGQMQKLKPVAKAIRKHAGAKRLATFPSVTPMVADGMRAQPDTSRSWGLIRNGLAIIGLGLAAFIAAGLAGLV
ncbi:MAG: hypothetical protein HRU11_06560 [Parvularculaceae bacterium]|nr:hypothetical protein [Parvularculaceae bacterium]